MGKRLAVWKSLGSRKTIVPAIVGAGALALFIVVAVARKEEPSARAPSQRPLSTEMKERLERKARELAPGASLYFSFVGVNFLTAIHGKAIPRS